MSVTCVILTRPAAQAAAAREALQRCGIEAHSLPLIDIGPPPDPAALARAWQELAGDALEVFASANAAGQFLAARPAGRQWPAGTLAAAPGPGTAAALRAAGVPAGQVVAPLDGSANFDSEALWALLEPQPWSGRRVLLVRGEQGREWLGEQLQAAGATVRAVAAYRRLAPRPDDAGRALLQRALARPRQWLWHFGSAEALRNLQALAPGADWSASRALATHPRIAEVARALGFGQVAVIAPGAAALAAAAGLEASDADPDRGPGPGPGAAPAEAAVRPASGAVTPADAASMRVPGVSDGASVPAARALDAAPVPAPGAADSAPG
ncbi:MAG: uroporphyrinogen-III synthase [Pseudomonadota bacterium]